MLGRKDGAFKLTTGEKVHPHRIESLLVNESQFISQALVLGSGENFTSALIYPAMSALSQWAGAHGITSDTLLGEQAVRDLFAEVLARLNVMIEVKYQRLQRAVLTDREPTLANGELTPSGKIVRKVVIDHQKEVLDELFNAQPKENVIVIQQPQLQKV